MTELLEKAVERVRSFPPETQDELARVILHLAGDAAGVHQLTKEEEASLAASLEQAERGEFAADDHVRSIWGKYGL